MHRLALVLLLSASAMRAEDKSKPVCDPVGLWLGALKVGSTELRLVFRVEKGKDEKLTGKLISLDQNNAELPITKASFADGKLSLEVAEVAAKYSGAFDEKGGIQGEFEQNGQSFPLILARIDKLPTAKRPQTPKKPYPYPSDDVTFENESAKIKLAGTLTLPKGDGPFPAVVLVSGSGPQDRDETLFEHKPFLVIADHLAKKGIACLRCDDRGVGKSGGTFVGSTSADFATDTYAAVNFLKGNPKIDPKRIGICGHSEGGLIAPLVAAAHPDDVAFIVLMAGPGISGERVLYEQAMDFSKLEDEKIEDREVKEMMEVVLPILKSAKSTADAKEKLKVALGKLIAAETDEKKRKEAEKGLGAALDQYSDPWVRWFVGHDPAPTLAKVKCPVLALNGEKDVQVKPKQNLEAIDAALKKSGHKNYECVEFKGLNHLFQTCKTGAVAEYGRIEQTTAPEVLTRISEWITARK